MNRRIFALGLLAGALLSSVSLPALADDGGHGDGEGNGGSGDGNGNGGSGGGGGDDGGHGNGDSGGEDDSGDGGSSGHGGSSGSGSNDHNDAKKAVDAAEAVPLDQVLAQFRQLGSFTVIDVKLSRSNRTLLYVIKYIDATGTVRRAFYDARSGIPMG